MRTRMPLSSWGACMAQVATGSATCPPPRACTSWSASHGARREQPLSSSPVRAHTRLGVLLPARRPSCDRGPSVFVPVDRPSGGCASVAAYFIGGAPRLKLEEVVHSPADRFRLQVRWSRPPLRTSCAPARRSG